MPRSGNWTASCIDDIEPRLPGMSGTRHSTIAKSSRVADGTHLKPGGMRDHFWCLLLPQPMSAVELA